MSLNQLFYNSSFLAVIGLVLVSIFTYKHRHSKKPWLPFLGSSLSPTSWSWSQSPSTPHHNPLKLSSLPGPDLKPPNPPHTISSKLEKGDWISSGTHCSLKTLRDCKDKTSIHSTTTVGVLGDWCRSVVIKGIKDNIKFKALCWLLSHPWVVEVNLLEK